MPNRRHSWETKTATARKNRILRKDDDIDNGELLSLTRAIQAQKTASHLVTDVEKLRLTYQTLKTDMEYR